MNRRIALRPEVPADLRELASYLDEQGRMTGGRFAERFLKTLDGLVAMPGKGSLKFYRGKRLQGIRSWSIRGLRKILILYRPTEDGIEVVGVMHGSRNIRAHLTRRLRNPLQ